MKRILVGPICIFLILLAYSAAQQVPETAPIVPSGSAPAKDAPQSGSIQPPTPPDYSQEAFVVESYRQTARFENDGTGREEQEARIKIISESGVQALGQLKVGYSALSDQLEIDYVRVRKPDGTVVTAQESAIQDLTIPDAPVYTDYHQKHISVPSLRPGDTLEYHYVRTIVNPLTPGQFWTSYSFNNRGIVLDEQVEINIPKAREVKLKTKAGYEPKISDEGDRRIYRWSHSHLKEEDNSKKKKRVEADEVPTIQLTTYQSWEQLGDWYRSLEVDRRQPSDAVKAKADSLTQGKSDDMAKVKAIYDYVSSNFRYVSLSFGLGRYQPHAASEVISLGYGDCKDKNTLLASLLQAAGFESTSVLINARRDLDPDVPSPAQFDHVITRVPVSGQEIWLDSTSGVAPFRVLSFTLRDKQALAIPPTGKPGLVRTPAELPFEAYDRSRMDGALNDTGKLTAHFSASVRGDEEMGIRFALRQIPSTKWKDLLQAGLRSSPLKGGEISNLKVSDPSDTDTPLQLDYDVAVPNYFDWSAAEPKLALPMTGIRLQPAAEDDDSASPKPIKLGAPQESQTDVALTIPTKYTVQLPIGVDVKRDYVEYHSSYKLADNRLTGSRVLKVALKEIPYDRREDWAAFRRVVESDQAQYITLDNTAPGVSGLTGTTSADDTFDSGTQALNNRNYPLAIELFERVQKAEPNHKGLQTSLGRAYLAMNQDQKAVEAFQKQIAANAYDQSAYNDLALAYEHQQKYEDAITQFKKQIEINPLDANAHANLGILYLNLKRFSEAVPELEKATSIQPKNPLLLIALGQAYVAIDQSQKGMASFEKAINIAPVPLIWNNIAYALAEQNVQLSRADRYADTALNALETQLRDVSLANLRMQDLQTTQMLFNVWDTKGWVLFKNGDPEKAEAYIVAAWSAAENGSVAEHLGEISEMRGMKEQAIRYYAMALAVDSPSVNARAKLTALGVTGGGIDRAVEDGRKQLLQQRTVRLDATQKGTADFFLLVSPGKVEDVKFVTGEESLRSFADVLKGVSVPMKFPPAVQVHVIRRVTVSCGTSASIAKAATGAKSKGKTKGGSAAEPFVAPAASGPELPGPCTLEWLPASDVHGID